jgi:hypothetical protein
VLQVIRYKYVGGSLGRSEVDDNKEREKEKKKKDFK